MARGSYCGVRLCPCCQWRRSRIWQARVGGLGDRLKGRLIFLSLTVRNCAVGELRENLGQMAEGWHRLIRRRTWPGTGYLRSVEVTRGQDGNAHPHIHALIQVPSNYFQKSNPQYLHQEQWAKMWQESAELDYWPIVDIRAVRGKKDDAFREVTKYTVKRADLVGDAPWIVEAAQQLSKSRAVCLGGTIRKGIKNIERDDDPATADDLDPDADGTDIRDGATRWFRFDPSAGRYAEWGPSW
ncbi:protein rep [Niveispirillum sp. SYP-B3756]|uniref:protein rep n=1 Tax=Niveispirillum sp. SYP-B3756 TaxID=2662178 RepID=UPI001FFFF43B|nr:protein rep [Niveispirillum sp. SYP-B3756]